MKISVTILTKNCAETLKKTLDSVASFDEVVILDTGSTDGTLDIARTYPNVTVHTSPFIGFGPAHNLATSLTRNDWVLSIDSDEALSNALIEEIQQLHWEPNTTGAILRMNYYNGKHIKWCGGWHPDWVVRLYHRQTTRFTDDAVHEKIATDGMSIVRLSSPLYHTPYRRIEDFLNKMQTYSSLFAEQHGDKKRSSLCKAVLHGWFAFLKSYLLKRGIFGGREGFIISAYNGHTAFYKYLKLAEKNSQISDKSL